MSQTEGKIVLFFSFACKHMKGSCCAVHCGCNSPTNIYVNPILLALPVSSASIAPIMKAKSGSQSHGEIRK